VSKYSKIENSIWGGEGGTGFERRCDDYRVAAAAAAAATAVT